LKLEPRSRLRAVGPLYLALFAGSAIGQNTASDDSGNGAAAIQRIREQARTYIQDVPQLSCTLSTRQTVTIAGFALSESREDSCDTKLYKLFAVQAVTLAEGPAAFRNRSRRAAGDSVSSDWRDRLAEASLESASAFLAALVDPHTRTEFMWVRTGTLKDRRVSVFSFRVPASEGYALVDTMRTIRVPYKGLLFADPLTSALIRVEIKCVNIPRDSEYTGADLALDFSPSRVGGRLLPLPSHSVVHFQMTRGEATNEANYRSYRLFSTDSEMKFETEAGEESR
jgi:hypothetical protein